MRVEPQDGQGVEHAGQLRNISATGASLCFQRSQLSALAALATGLRLCSRSCRSIHDPQVAIPWMVVVGTSCMGVRFAEHQVDTPLLQDLLAA